MQFLARTLARVATRWWLALGVVAVLACAILPIGLGMFGLWEPHERALSDKVDHDHPPAAVSGTASGTMSGSAGQGSAVVPAPPPPPPLPPPTACPKSAPPDAYARTLAPHAVELGRDVSDSDTGRRLPFALLGILCVLATAGIAMRTAGPRAGAIAGLIVMSMPLLVFQSRQVDSEIGTATGAALAIYGLLALSATGDVLRALPLGLGPPRRSPLVATLDVATGALALIAGLVLGFVSGGGLLGVLVPVGAFAAAGAFGIPALADLARMIRNLLVTTAARFGLRWSAGRTLVRYRRTGTGVALLATAIAGVVIAALAYQAFSLHDAQAIAPGATPPSRELFGHAIVAPACWSPALGGVWRADDDVRQIFDSTFEQIAYGTFPWGVLAPLAFAGLLALKDRAGAPSRSGHKRLGALTLAWASASWLATEVFSRKVGFAMFAGFPALAIALGGWLDAMLAEQEATRYAAEPERERGRGPALLVATFAFFAILDLAKDLESFTEKLTSLLVGNDSIPYPTNSQLLFLPTRLWVLALGGAIALAVALALGFGHARSAFGRRTGRIAAYAAGALTISFAAFWSWGWQPALGVNLSSKSLFETAESLRKPGDQLILTNDLVSAQKDYAADFPPEIVAGHAQILTALGRPNRVFAIVAASDRCALHHEIGEKPYFVIDDRNARSLLLSNKVDGTTDKNPLGAVMIRKEPANIKIRAPGRIVWEGHIQLVGWDIPDHIARGSRFEIRTYYKVLGPIGGAWTVLYHFDSNQFGRAFNGDHPPIDGVCPTSTWQTGDYIVDTFTATAGNSNTGTGKVDVWTGFFTGTTPNFKNMPISESPGNMRDPNPTDRVKITTITLD